MSCLAAGYHKRIAFTVKDVHNVIHVQACMGIDCNVLHCRCVVECGIANIVCMYVCMSVDVGEDNYSV